MAVLSLPFYLRGPNAQSSNRTLLPAGLPAGLPAHPLLNATVTILVICLSSTSLAVPRQPRCLPPCPPPSHLHYASKPARFPAPACAPTRHPACHTLPPLLRALLSPSPFRTAATATGAFLVASVVIATVCIRFPPFFFILFLHALFHSLACLRACVRACVPPPRRGRRSRRGAPPPPGPPSQLQGRPLEGH